MRFPRPLGLLILCAGLALASGCAAAAPAEPPPDTPTLAAYHTASPTATLGFPTATVVPVTTPPPSPTPFTHTVRSNETLIGIASQYGLTLDALLAANPGISPRLLSIGQQLLIPGPEGEPAAALAPTPTPVPLTFSPVRCHPSASGGLWCGSLARNPGDLTVEGLEVTITLVDDAGEPIASRSVHAPLERLPARGQVPLLIDFPPPAPRAAGAVLSLVGAVAGREDGRALPVAVTRLEHQPAPDRRAWTVTGTLELGQGTGRAAARARLVLTALDELGDPVGYRVLDLEGGLEPGQAVEFTLTVYSLGPRIERVLALPEALAAPEED